MENKQNVVYFESATMKGLFREMASWQVAKEKRFLSTSIHEDAGQFCCIALTNAMEVVVVDPEGKPCYVGTGSTVIPGMPTQPYRLKTTG